MDIQLHNIIDYQLTDCNNTSAINISMHSMEGVQKEKKIASLLTFCRHSLSFWPNLPLSIIVIQN